jgi:hypothetical protein
LSKEGRWGGKTKTRVAAVLLDCSALAVPLMIVFMIFRVGGVSAVNA